MCRRALVVLACLVTIAMLTGCGGEKAPPAPAEGDVLSVAGTQVEVASAANLKTLTFHAPTVNPGVGFYATLTCLYGTNILRLQQAAQMSLIAFESTRDQAQGEIYTMDPDGRNVSRLTNNTAKDERPAWSPDGRKIVFDTNRDGNFEIYTMSATGLGPVRLTNTASADVDPQYSPDGQNIVFASNRDGNYEIYTMKADGTGPRRLTNHFSADRHPTYSPNGQRIAFDSNRDGPPEVYVMRSDGSDLIRVVQQDTLAESEPAYAPDGTRLAFAREGAGGAGGAGGTALTWCVVGGDGRTFYDWQNIVSTRYQATPSFSPDGYTVAYSTRHVPVQTGDREICKTSLLAAAGNSVNLTDNGVDDVHPAWSKSFLGLLRTLIGPSGSDRGANPPFGSSRYLAVIAMTDMQALTGAATITVDAAQAATVAAAVLPDIGPGLAGLQVTATAIKGVAQDNGQGRPPDNWDLTASPAGAVLLYFDGRSGRIASVVALADVALAAAGLAPVTTATSQGQIAVRGEIVAAYDAGAPAQNHVRGRAAQVLLDRRTGRILHVQ